MATLTGRGRREEQALQELLLNRIVQRHQRRVQREISRAMRVAANDVEQGSSPEFDHSEHVKRMTTILTDLWHHTGETFSEHILGVGKAAYGPEWLKGLRDVTPTRIMDGVMADWIRRVGATEIKLITDTTRTSIKLVIAAGIRAGESEREIARTLRAVAPTKSASRAQTIARTESHRAANASAQFTAEATGINMVRVWVAAQVGREGQRESHQDADGQKRGMNEAFIVDGEPLMYPGDPAGSAHNVINCLCAVVYELD